MINKALLAEQLKRFWAVPVAAFTLLFVFGLLPIFALTNLYDPYLLHLELWRLFRLENWMIFLILLITPLPAAYITMMSFISKNEMTAFYSFPAKKSQIHLTNALAGIILTALPIVFFCLILLIPIEYREPPRTAWQIEAGIVHSFAEDHFTGPLFPGDVVVEGGRLNTVPAVLLLFVRMMIIVLFNFALFWFAFSLAGHGVIAILLAGAIPLTALIFPFIVNELFTIYVFGAPTRDPVFPNTAIYATNPALWWESYWPTTEQALMVAIIAYSIVGTALAVLAFIISGKRKAENTDSSIMFKPVKNLLIFLVSFAIGLVAGLVTWQMSPHPSVFYIGVVMGFVVGFFVSQMIAEKSFAIWHKTKYLAHFGGVLVVIYVSLHVFTQFSFGFYVNRVPPVERIIGVYASGDGTARWWLGSGAEWLFVTDPEVIQLTRQVHENVIAERANTRLSPWNIERHQHGGWWHFGRHIFTVEYLLDNRRTIRRFYTLPRDAYIRASITELLTQREIILASHDVIADVALVRSVELRHFLHRGDVRIGRELVDTISFTSPKSIGLIVEKLRDSIVAFERAWIEANIIGKQETIATHLVNVGTIYIEGEYTHHFNLIFELYWDDLPFTGSWMMGTSYGVCKNFIDDMMDSLAEVGENR